MHLIPLPLRMEELIPIYDLAVVRQEKESLLRVVQEGILISLDFKYDGKTFLYCSTLLYILLESLRVPVPISLDRIEANPVLHVLKILS